jgi:catechol-2,3-dioxygenase
MSNEPGISLSQIGQISVNAHDLARAVVFYKETLGLKHLFSVPPKMAFFDCGASD